MTVFTSINYYAKHLVSSSERKQKMITDDKINEKLNYIKIYFDKNINTLSQLLNGQTAKNTVVWELKQEREFIERLPDEQEDKSGIQIQFIDDLEYVWSINQALVELAIDLGAHIKKDYN